MGFFYAPPQECLPMRGPRKALPMRSRKFRRLQLLKDYRVGRVYTFPAFYNWEIPKEDTLWHDANKLCRNENWQPPENRI